ncbi:MAG: hypothetical protein M0R74_06935 [Dehalococcoidia bacterium]|nr:hypothetical protein [Dehalococcoidia bacterium]
MDALALVLIFGTRGLVPLLIFRWPFWGGLLSIAADGFDTIIQDVLGAEPLRGHYHTADKLFDTYYLAIEAWVAFLWDDQLARWTAVVLFAWRAAGVVFFEFTEARATLLVTPNIFENFFLFVAGLRTADPAWRVRTPERLLGIVLLVGAPKVLQEYAMHYRAFQTWHFVRDEIILFWKV